MNCYDLLEAIGSLDEAIIEDARKEMPRRKPVWYRLGAIAACLLLTAFLPFAIRFLKSGINLPMAGSPPPAAGPSPGSSMQTPNFIYPCGTPVTTKNGTLMLTAYDHAQHTVSFLLYKTTDQPLSFFMTGYDESSRTLFYALSSASQNDAAYKDGITCTVNGVPAEELPTAVGYYAIVLDYSAMYNRCASVSPRIRVTGYGYFRCSDTEAAIP